LKTAGVSILSIPFLAYSVKIYSSRFNFYHSRRQLLFLRLLSLRNSYFFGIVFSVAVKAALSFYCCFPGRIIHFMGIAGVVVAKVKKSSCGEIFSTLLLKGCHKKQENPTCCQELILGCSGLARSGIGRRTNHTM